MIVTKRDSMRAETTLICTDCGTRRTVTDYEVVTADLPPQEYILSLHDCAPPTGQEPNRMTESEAMCPSCGYPGLTLIEGNRLVCTRTGCRYEHLVTTTMPIIVIASPEPD